MKKIYIQETILKKIKELELKKVIIVFKDKNYDLALTNKSFYSEYITNIIIMSNNQIIMNIDNANQIMFSIWFKRLSNMIKSEQKIINDGIKSILEKNPNLINYSESQITEILNKEELKYPLESKEKILEIRNASINNFIDNLCNSNQINSKIQNAYNTYNDEILTKIIQTMDYNRKEILKKEINTIIRLLIIIAITILNKALLPKVLFIIGEIVLIGLNVNSIKNNITQIKIGQRRKLKNALNLMNKTKKEITLTKNNLLNNNSQEVSKEENKIRKDSYLESLKECIKLMTENPNIDWSIEKEKIKILTDGYIEIKKTSKLDSYLLLQKYPNFISELCDLEISIKDKIKDIQNKETYEEDAEEITTLLDNIKTPEIALKLERKL